MQIQRKALSLHKNINNVYMTENKKQDITTELRGALQEVKDHMEGKKQLQSLDSLLDELSSSRFFLLYQRSQTTE